MNAIAKIREPATEVDCLDLTDEDIALVKREAAKLPWRWDVRAVTLAPEGPNHPPESFMLVMPLRDDDAVPFWLPEFGIERSRRGYMLSVQEFDPIDASIDETGIVACDTAAEAMAHISQHIGAMLETWCLRAPARDLPEAA